MTNNGIITVSAAICEKMHARMIVAQPVIFIIHCHAPVTKSNSLWVQRYQGINRFWPLIFAIAANLLDKKQCTVYKMGNNTKFLNLGQLKGHYFIFHNFIVFR